jgi:ankyrin repeat protein
MALLFRRSLVASGAFILVLALLWISLVSSCYKADVEGSEIRGASMTGDLAKVQALLDHNHGLVSSTNREGWTALHYAAAYDHKDVAELLLASKADVNARTERGFTPLHVAVYYGQRDLVALLLAHGASVNAATNQGVTAMHSAKKKGAKELEELLRQNGGYDAPVTGPEWYYP